MKNKFRGWNTVFNFTFRQATKGVGFKLVTALVTIFILGTILLINILVAKPDKVKEVEVSPIEAVYVLDHSGLAPTDYKLMNPELSGIQFQQTEFVVASAQTKIDVLKEASVNSSETIAVIISAKDGGYELEAVIPAESTISKKEADRLLDMMLISFESSKLMQSGLSVEQLSTILMPVVTSYTDIGEDTSGITFAIKMIAPMLFGLMLYLMLLLYGQSISKSVSTEKTSKLMETLLTSIHPYALITGKVLATTSMALIQFLTWIVAIVVGLYGGNAVAHAIYPEYENTVVTVIDFIKDNIGETAMTLPALLLAILIFAIGFLFYCFIAGLAGSMVSKPEDVAATQSIFVFPVIISWLVCYLSPIMGNEGVMKVARLIPFTIPFSVPVDLITGTIGIGQGLISLAVLTVFSFLVIMLSGRLYKGLVLYTGQKFSFNMLGHILKADK
ncbi:MAG TPA: ABC transporter permease [Mobilitalea sp.]|nr:ABC transporter permease [Mobilitalea sp.]